MKKAFLLVAVVLPLLTTKGWTQLSPNMDLRQLVGERATLTGRIEHVYGGKDTTIVEIVGWGGPFSVVMSASATAGLCVADLVGHTVAVTGEVVMDREKVEIMVVRPGQIRLVDYR